MPKAMSVQCYLEEYDGEGGRPQVRLREKKTGRKVGLGATTQAGIDDFLRFTTAALGERGLMPGLFEKNDNRESIVVSGHVDFDSPDELRFKHDQQLSYLVD